MIRLVFPKLNSLIKIKELKYITKDLFVIKYFSYNDNKIINVLNLTSLMNDDEKDDYHMVVNLFDFMNGESSSYIFEDANEFFRLYIHADEILDDLQERMLERLDSIVLLCKTGK